MRFGGLGLRGKFVVALLIAAALPFVLGLLVFETTGYRYLLDERGRFHQMQARTLVKEIDQASDGQGESLRTWMVADLAVLHLVTANNRENAGRNPDDLTRETHDLDQSWPTLAANDPRLVAVIENPASNSLRQYQKLYPQVAEVLATDARGRLVAATGKSSDFDQADEAWWQKGATLRPGGKWTDVLSFDASSGVFSLDDMIPLYEGGGFAGVVKMSVDVTSLFAGLVDVSEAIGERWEIVLPDGRILARSQAGFVSGNDQLSAATLDWIRRKHGNGWTLIQDDSQEARMAGFAGMGTPGHSPSAYVVFSSRRDEVVGPLRRRFLEIGVAAAAVLALCAVGGFLVIHRNILQPLAALGRATRAISNTARLESSDRDDEPKFQQQQAQAQVDLETIRAIRTGDEVESLAGDLLVMASRILSYHRELEAEVAAKTAVIRADLEMAREFQAALLPSHYPTLSPAAARNPLRLQFAHFYQPASTVGGDFFDLLELDANRTGILIADVMGHGARSALITAILRALVRHHSNAAVNPGTFLSELNQHLREVIERSGQTLFVTAFFLVLDTSNGQATWAVAGHPAPLRVRRGSGKAPQPLWTEAQHQPALGLIADAKYHTTELPLKAGDVYLLFTDGAIEAEDPSGNRFGIERLAASLDAALDGPMAAMPAKMVCDVTAFQKRHYYDDDVCLVAVEAVNAVNSPI